MMVSEIEREPEYREPRNIVRTRNHSASVKLEITKAAAVVESPVKQNGFEFTSCFFSSISGTG